MGPEVSVPKVQLKANQLRSLHESAKKELEFVRQKLKKYYDQRRLEGPRLQKEDKVYLVARNLRNKPSAQLDFKKLGPLLIGEEKLSDTNYRLSLPPTMRLRPNVFHISLLELEPTTVRTAEHEEAEDEEVWDVEEVLDSKI